MKTSTVSTTSVTWRRPSPSMWVAEQHGDFVATIEQLHIFVVTGPSGDVLGSYSHLHEAQCAVENPVTPTTTRRHAARRRRAWMTSRWMLMGVAPALGVSVAAGALLTGVRL